MIRSTCSRESAASPEPQPGVLSQSLITSSSRKGKWSPRLFGWLTLCLFLHLLLGAPGRKRGPKSKKALKK